MRCMYIRYLLIAMIFLSCGMNGTQASASDSAEKQIVFLPGRDSHGWGAHSYAADCKLLAGILNENVPRIEAIVMERYVPSYVLAAGTCKSGRMGFSVDFAGQRLVLKRQYC